MDYFSDRHPDATTFAAAGLILDRLHEKISFNIKRTKIMHSNGTATMSVRQLKNDFDQMTFGQQHDFVAALAWLAIACGGSYNVHLKSNARTGGKSHVIVIVPPKGRL